MMRFNFLDNLSKPQRYPFDVENFARVRVCVWTTRPEIAGKVTQILDSLHSPRMLLNIGGALPSTEALDKSDLFICDWPSGFDFLQEVSQKFMQNNVKMGRVRPVVLLLRQSNEAFNFPQLGQFFPLGKLPIGIDPLEMRKKIQKFLIYAKSDESFAIN